MKQLDVFRVRCSVMATERDHRNNMVPQLHREIQALRAELIRHNAYESLHAIQERAKKGFC